MLDIRGLKKEDYDDILVGWWNQYGWTPPSREFLPDDGTGGLIVYDGDVPVCAGFMYATNSRVAWVDWIISNKDYRGLQRRRDALILLVESLTKIAKSSGYKYAYALIKHDGLIDVYKSIGYTKGDSYTSEMIISL
jgi:hypothetical protein